MSLSKSKYCQGIQCNKMLWLLKNKPELKEDINNDTLFEIGNTIHEVAKYLFGSHINIEFNSNLKEMIDNTALTCESYKDVVITEASFNYQNNFCSVDILKKNNNDYEIYEVKGSTKLKDVYIDDISYQYYVLKSLGLNIKKCYLVHLNSDYVRHGELDINELFIMEDVFAEVKSMQDKVKSNLDKINNCLASDIEPERDLDIYCFKPYECPFFKYCAKHLPKNNVFDIASMKTSTKIDLYKEGIYSFENLLDTKINDKYKQQIEFELFNKDEYIDRAKIKEFLDELSEPIYFLDFETFQMPIPLYDNLKHKEFLAEASIDPRRSLALSLVNDIPLNVCTLAYNMSFEKTVIKKLAQTYPDLHEHLMNIHDNIKDLMVPFQKRYYYKKEMMGSYSIKKVLPALFKDDPSLDYHNLDLIHNGSEAMTSYANLGNLSKDEQEYTRERLLRYCELDTYAMVKIYDKIKEEVLKN